MENIVPDLSSNLSKIWTKIKNIENSLFPELQEQLGILSSKEEKLIKILDFAQIEKNITVVKITNTPKDREEMARSFIAKSVYNMQTTRDLIDRLKIDRTLRVLCGWRYAKDIPSEAKFSRVFDELSELRIAEKTHQQFIQEYLSDTLFHYSASDATAIGMRQKAAKKEEKEEEPKVKRKRGRPKKVVVEDDKKVAGFIKKGLEEETYAIDVAYDGEDGLHFGSEGQYDLIILDIMLPKVNGLEICRYIHRYHPKAFIFIAFFEN